MSLVELRAFARRLGLVNALNLDGGGSTTMWVQGAVVNKPSDAIGPRKVSDALLVYRRALTSSREGHEAREDRHVAIRLRTQWKLPVMRELDTP